MRAINITRRTTLATAILEADTFFRRMKGLLGTPGLADGHGLWISPCRGIHSIGMRYRFDILFLDISYKVVGLCSRFRRNRISPVFLRARGVLELPAGTIEKTGTAVGDTIELRPKPWADP